MKALIVDDEPSLAALMQEALRRIGWEVTTANSLEDAQHKAGPFDVVVADVRLPNGDGRHLRELHPGTPFISMSGFPGERPDLQKPFGPAALRSKVLDAIKPKP